MATELLGAKGLALLRWSSRRMLCMPEEEVRGGITMGSIDEARVQGRRAVGGLDGIDEAEEGGREAREREQRRWGLRA
jgi:hypothetical protein